MDLENETLPLFSRLIMYQLQIYRMPDCAHYFIVSVPSRYTPHYPPLSLSFPREENNFLMFYVQGMPRSAWDLRRSSFTSYLGGKGLHNYTLGDSLIRFPNVTNFASNLMFYYVHIFFSSYPLILQTHGICANSLYHNTFLCILCQNWYAVLCSMNKISSTKFQ